MSKKGKGSNFHPARISGIQKQWREREANKRLAEKNKKPKDILVPAEEYFKK